MQKTLAVALIPFFLAACGGGSGADGTSAGSGPTSSDSGSVVLSGQVVDGPIAGARVCLFRNGVQARNAAGEAICSSDTDAQGNYSLTIPRNLAPGFLTLVATKGSNIALAAPLGSHAQVIEAAGNSSTVTPDTLPNARVTHFTTADFALADVNADDTVSQSEFDSYVADFAKVQKVAAVVKAVVDGGQSASLIGGQTTNTLALAAAASRNQPLGSTNKTADEWLADPANAAAINAVNGDVARDLEGRFSNYLLSTAVTSSHVPATIVRNSSSGPAEIFCGVETAGESSPVQIAFDATRRVVVIKYGEGQMVGSYNPQTGAVVLSETNPRHVAMTGSSGITYYSEGSFTIDGTFNAVTGSVAGSFAEMTATTWTLDSTRQQCTSAGTLTATRR